MSNDSPHLRKGKEREAPAWKAAQRCSWGVCAQIQGVFTKFVGFVCDKKKTKTLCQPPESLIPKQTFTFRSAVSKIPAQGILQNSWEAGIANPFCTHRCHRKVPVILGTLSRASCTAGACQKMHGSAKSLVLPSLIKDYLVFPDL